MIFPVALWRVAFPRGRTGSLSVWFCLVFAFPAGVKALQVQDCAVIATAGGSCLQFFPHLRLRPERSFLALEERRDAKVLSRTSTRVYELYGPTALPAITGKPLCEFLHIIFQL